MKLYGTVTTEIDGKFETKVFTLNAVSITNGCDKIYHAFYDYNVKYDTFETSCSHEDPLRDHKNVNPDYASYHLTISKKGVKGTPYTVDYKTPMPVVTFTYYNETEKTTGCKVSDTIIKVKSDSIPDNDKIILTDSQGFRYVRQINPNVEGYFYFVRI